MTERESIAIANKYKHNISTEDKIKWLATEVVEVSIAFGNGDNKNLIEELEDCAFLISHILSRYTDCGIVEHISNAAIKMEKRFKEK